MNSVRFLSKIFTLLLLSAMFAACAGPAAPKKAPLRIAYTDWWGDYTIIIADKKGFFKKYGLEVKTIYYDVFSKALPELASGQLDGGTLTIGDTMSVNAHTSLTAVALSDDGGASVVLARPEITQIADLKGKQIGIIIGSSYELMIDEMLREAGLKPGDVNLVDIDPENIPQALADNKIQAGFTWEPYTTQAIGAGNNLIYSSETSGLFADTIVFRTEVVNQRPEDIRNYLRAWFEAVEYRIAEPEEANHQIAFTLNKQASDIVGDAKLLLLRDNLNAFTQTPAGKVTSIYTIAQLNADFLIRNGNLTKMPSLLQLFNPAYLEK